MVDRTVQLKHTDKQRIAQRPRRSCGLQPAPVDADVVGKVRHLSLGECGFDYQLALLNCLVVTIIVVVVALSLSWLLLFLLLFDF